MAKAKAQRKMNGTEKPPVRPTENERVTDSTITKDAIARRAYALYLARGAQEGHDLEDWLQAERELRQDTRFLT